MAVPAGLLVEAQLASPELALVDPELAAELRRTLSPVEDRWLRPPARVEDASAESEDPPVRLADDAGYAESRDTQRLLDDECIVATPPEQTPAEELRPSSHSPVLPAPEPDEAAFERSPPRPLASFEPSIETDEDDTGSVGCRRGPPRSGGSSRAGARRRVPHHDARSDTCGRPDEVSLSGSPSLRIRRRGNRRN